MSIGPISRYDYHKLDNGPYENDGREHDDDCDCELCYYESRGWDDEDDDEDEEDEADDDD